MTLLPDRTVTCTFPTFNFAAIPTSFTPHRAIGVEFIKVEVPNASAAFVPVGEGHVRTLANCSTSSAARQAARYPDSSQPNTSFPILIRTSPTSKIPAVPLSWGPKLAFNAGIIISGRLGTVGKRRASSLWRPPKVGEAGRGVFSDPSGGLD